MEKGVIEGHRVTGDCRKGSSRGAGWDFLHVCVDDASRLAYTEILPSERKEYTTAFLERALAWLGRRGVSVERVMTDNGSAYRSGLFRKAVAEAGAKHVRTRPYTPSTNGKAERFIQTSLREWAYARAYASSSERSQAIGPWSDAYNLIDNAVISAKLTLQPGEWAVDLGSVGLGCAGALARPLGDVMKRFGFLALLVGLAALIAPLAAAAQPAATPPALAPSLSDQVVPMRDGVKLSADIYLPAGKGPWPVVLIRTPYDKAARVKTMAPYFVARGYAFVAQDLRGRYASGGHWSFTGVDAKDGYDTTVWIGAQPWSNGKIGTVGTSYEGGTQHAMALAGAPGLTAMVPLFAVSDVGEFGMRHQGAFELRFFNWVFSMGAPGGPSDKAAARAAIDDPAAAPALAALGAQAIDYVKQLPLRAGTTPLKYAPDYERWLVEALGHGDDDAFWTDSGYDVVDHVGQWKDVPAYHMTGWYDSWLHSVADLNFATLRAAKKSPQRLIIGPWMHSSPTLSYAGDAQFTDDAAIDLNEFERRWFDQYLKGIDTGLSREAPVRIYVMGGGDGHKTAEGRIFVGGHWRDEQAWPLARAKATAWYLHAGGVLSPEPPVATAPSVSYVFDPRHPVPTLGGNNSSQGKLATQGGADQTCKKGVGACEDNLPLSSRNDIVVFRSTPRPRRGDHRASGGAPVGQHRRTRHRLHR